MSATADAQPGTARTGGGGLVIAAAGAAVLAALWFFGGGERELNRSATGFAGLVEWLDENGAEARTFRGAGYLVQGEIGLRVLPLHDTDLGAARVPPETPEALVDQTSETDLYGDVLASKLRLLPTLVVLPKWRSGVRVLGAAHRDLLIPDRELDRLVAQIPSLRGDVRRDPAGYAETRGPGGSIGLFHPQRLTDSGCTPVIGTQSAMLLGRCALPAPGDGDPAAQQFFWLLADPDLMDNHGLALAGNAAVTLAVVGDIAGDGPVVLDLTDYVATVDADWLAESHERSWADLARLFDWPFGVVWVAFGALAVLVLWRALVRYGPVEDVEDGEAMRASREVSIDAKARLLRLADHDAALMRMHFGTRLHQLAAELLGPHRPAGTDPLALLTGLVGRRAPDLARALDEAARLPDGPQGGADDLLRRLDRFEDCLDRIRDEFGRAAGARG